MGLLYLTPGAALVYRCFDFFWGGGDYLTRTPLFAKLTFLLLCIQVTILHCVDLLYFFPSMAQQPLMDQGFLIVEAS
jgi:hypothetical protein